MDFVDRATRSRMMSRVKAKDTAPELAVRKLAHGMGLRFRLHRRDLPGRPDMVFPKYRLALFVHGCYWHRHQGCRRACQIAFKADPLFAFNYDPPEGAGSVVPVSSIG
jgi:DNA mismatch endonuclease (patch repair protein)